ncbi:MAG: trans-aconitate 2-methyltransferase [Alphaproteobacteria bacterium]|nr:trans-aconitate 2-methyltransferase [Alphaproteobacteria bacterium]
MDRTAPNWDPAQYLKFADHRLRPAVDLLGRVDLSAQGTVVDLGCGAGNVTALLRRRWPDRSILGVDSSPAMLKKARETLPGVVFVQADVGRWQPDAPVALIYSNAALHWLDDHASLFPKLMGMLRSGGALAVQMPRNHGAPSHTAMVESAADRRFQPYLAKVLRPNPVARPQVYREMLAPHAATLDLWETEYLHVLEGDNPVVEWTKGTALRPLIEALPNELRADFLADYARRVAAAYPPAGDGRTLFPFRRLFLVASAH